MKIFDPEFTGSITFLTPIAGGFTGSLFGTASVAESVATASYVKTAQTASYFTASNLVGDIILGTQTSGQYVGTVTQGTGVTVTGGTGENSTATIAIGQAVETTSNVQFANVTASKFSASFGFTGSLLGTASLASSVTNLIQDVYITGSLFIKNDLVVFGTSSIKYVTSSQLDISTNLITVNTEAQTLRFGGLAVIDSGSSPKTSGSILYDSVQDEWIFVHRGASNVVTSSHFIMGPETYGTLGDEIYIPATKLIRSTGNEHVTGSNIHDDGTLVIINSPTVVTGSIILSGSIGTELKVIGESQITGSLQISNGIVAQTITASQGASFSGQTRITGSVVITGSLIVSGANGSGVFSKGGNYVDIVNGVPPVTASIYVWRAPFPCQAIAVYGIKSGSSNVSVNAAKVSGGTTVTHLASNITLNTNDTWTAGGAVQNASYAIGDTLEFFITGTFFQCGVQVDFIKTL